MPKKYPQLLNVKKAAEILLVTPKTVRQWAKKNLIKGIKVGLRGDWRFKLSDLLSIFDNKGGVKNDNRRKNTESRSRRKVTKKNKKAG